jgi:dGTPase
LEAQIANLADEIAYYSHDLDDGLDCHLIHPIQLEQLEVWQESYEDVKRRYPEIEGRELNAYVIRCIIDREVEDVIVTSAQRIAAAKVQSVEEVRRQPAALIGYSERLCAANRALRTFLYANLYYHPDVDQVNRRACEMLHRVFAAYLENPNLLGANTVGRMEADGLHRTVCDYLSGMTDRYLLDEYKRLFGA